MEKEQFKILAKAMSVAWPNSSFMTETEQLDIWFSMLKDIPYRVASAAVQKYMSENHYPPAIADIRKEAANILAVDDGELPELAAWDLVRSAISNGYYGAEKEFEKLPDLVKQAIGSPTYLRNYAVDQDFNESVAQSNFCRCYRTVLERKKQDSKLSLNLREEIKAIRMEVKREQAEALLVDKGEK